MTQGIVLHERRGPQITLSDLERDVVDTPEYQAETGLLSRDSATAAPDVARSRAIR
jgi:hypothetical protein